MSVLEAPELGLQDGEALLQPGAGVADDRAALWQVSEQRPDLPDRCMRIDLSAGGVSSDNSSDDDDVRGFHQAAVLLTSVVLACELHLSW